MRPQGLARATTILGLARIVQQALLFVQLGYFLYVFGSSQLTDAFFVAQTLPTFFALVFTRSFSQSFVPIFADWRESRGIEEAWRLASAILIWTVGVATVVTLVVMLAAPWLVVVLAPGMSAESQELSASLLRDYALLISISAVSSIPRSLYYNYRFYTIPAWSPVIPNVTTIAAIFFWSASLGVRSVVWGMVLGWGIELAILLLMINRGERRFRFTLGRGGDGVRRFGVFLGPRTVATAIGRLNVIIDRMFASGLSASSISALTYADNLTFAPQELVNASFGTATLTVLSDDAAARNHDEFKRRVAQYLRVISLLIIPMTVLFLLLSEPLIELLFGRGKFDQSAIQLTAGAVAFYSIGLLPMSIAVTLNGAFFSLQDSMTPLKVSLFGLVLNIAFDALLVGPMGLFGIALATSLCGFIKMVLLIWLIEKKVGSLGLRDLAWSIGKLLAAAIAMAGIIWVSTHAAPEFRTRYPFIGQAIRLTLFGTLGGLTFLAVCRWMGVAEISVVVARFRNIIERRRKRQPLSDV